MSVEENRGWLAITFTVPEIADPEFQCLSVCMAAMEQMLKDDYQAKKRIMHYLLARYTI